MLSISLCKYLEPLNFFISSFFSIAVCINLLSELKAAPITIPFCLSITSDNNEKIPPEDEFKITSSFFE